MSDLHPGLDADERQTALTERFLLPALPALEAFFLEVRAETDKALAGGPDLRSGKAYPYGYCMEINNDVVARLAAMSARPESEGYRALRAFLDNGGAGCKVWGVLRDRYFQNALQLGSLYVDVSNDTVDVTKPKIEILPMAESGFELVRDGAHFARIAQAYWGASAYANTALPALAPVFPVILVGADGQVELHSSADYMMLLFSANGFALAEQWLREGPPAPIAVVEALRAHAPEDLLQGGFGASAALEACQALRATTRPDAAFFGRMGALFDRAPKVRLIPRQGAGEARA